MTKAPAGPSREQVEAACELLGLREGVTREDILSAWKSAIRAVHPDLATEAERSEAEERTKSLNQAKEQLLRALDGHPRLALPPRQVRVKGGAPARGTTAPGRGVKATPTGHAEPVAPQRPAPPQTPIQTRARPQHAVRRPPPMPVGRVAPVQPAAAVDRHEGDRGTNRVLLVAIGICVLVLALIVIGALVFSNIDGGEPKQQQTDIAPSTPVAPAGAIWID